jgi:hypothetical protein
MERTKTLLSCLTDKCFPPASSLPPPACFVYNIEVHGEHVYQVGELGVVVHNTSSIGGLASKSKAVRSLAKKRNFLKSLASHPNTPRWMKQWLSKGKNPPGYDVDHILPRSVGGLDEASNMRLQLRELHRMHHRFYRPWE